MSTDFSSSEICFKNLQFVCVWGVGGVYSYSQVTYYKISGLVYGTWAMLYANCRMLPSVCGIAYCIWYRSSVIHDWIGVCIYAFGQDQGIRKKKFVWLHYSISILVRIPAEPYIFFVCVLVLSAIKKVAKSKLSTRLCFTKNLTLSDNIFKWYKIYWIKMYNFLYVVSYSKDVILI